MLNVISTPIDFVLLFFTFIWIRLLAFFYFLLQMLQIISCYIYTSQLTIAFSKSATETLEKGVKFIQS